VSAVTRRELLRSIGTGAPLAIPFIAADARASEETVSPAPDAVAMLYDTTLCIGCKACVVACAETNGLKPDTVLSGGLWQMPLDLNPHTKNIIKLCEGGNGETSFVKRQCMHCLDPACVAGCPFGALQKGNRGVVTWNPSACIGCRYCEVSCPFEVPKFEWDAFNPKVVKCEFCHEQRLDKGQEPACTDVCPTDAVIFGSRVDLLRDAHARLQKRPGDYAEKRVYGEFDAGGTQVLYLSHLPFANIGLPALSPDQRPGREMRFQVLLYKWLLLPFAIYALLMRVIRRRWREHDAEVTELEKQHGLKEQL